VFLLYVRDQAYADIQDGFQLVLWGVQSLVA